VTFYITELRLAELQAEETFTDLVADDKLTTKLIVGKWAKLNSLNVEPYDCIVDTHYRTSGIHKPGTFFSQPNS
jgi:hypothetical protein